jgi:hypothetical protein
MAEIGRLFKKYWLSDQLRSNPLTPCNKICQLNFYKNVIEIHVEKKLQLFLSSNC